MHPIHPLRKSDLQRISYFILHIRFIDSAPSVSSSAFSINGSSMQPDLFPNLASRFINDSAEKSISLSTPPSTPPRNIQKVRASTPPRSIQIVKTPTPPRTQTLSYAPPKPSGLVKSVLPIRSIHKLDAKALSISNEIHTIALLVSIILRSGYCRSILQEIQFFIRLLGCGMELEYDTNQPFFTYPPWSTLKINCRNFLSIVILVFHNPTNCFLFAVTLFDNMTEIMAFLPVCVKVIGNV